jgi:hypothetical protein
MDFLGHIGVTAYMTFILKNDIIVNNCKFQRRIIWQNKKWTKE